MLTVHIWEAVVLKLSFPTHSGILGEVQEWVEPVVTNKPLRSAFLHYIQPPRTLEKLKALTAFVSTSEKQLVRNLPFT